MRLSRDVNRRVGRAMHDYAMLADGDRVLVAVSGGIDSLVLAWLLADWRKKAPIEYELRPCMSTWMPARMVPGLRQP
jgi:tRNA 2-thiocytidine biosynthesis protein TtcA